MFTNSKGGGHFRDKAFTLIELLAVIVVLAIISLIATPIILNLIETSRKGAALRSAEGIVRAGNMYYMDSQLDGKGPSNISFSCTKDGCISSETNENGEALKLDMDGNAGIGNVAIDVEGNISFKLEKNGYCSYKNANEKQINIVKGQCDSIELVDAIITKAEDITSQIVMSAEKYVADFKKNNDNNFPDSDIIFNCNQNGCLLETELPNYNTNNLKQLDYDETRLDSGNIIIRNNGEIIETTDLNIDDIVCAYLDGKSFCTYKKDLKSDGTKILFNPVTGKECNNYESSQSAFGVIEGCMRWYIFLDNENSAVYNLLLDHDVAKTVWASSSSSSSISCNGPVELLTELKNMTNNWTGIRNRSDYYQMSWSRSDEITCNYKIDYLGHKARLIEAEEIAQILHLSDFSLSVSVSSSFPVEEYKWITSSYPGYWTASPCTKMYTGGAWYIYTSFTYTYPNYDNKGVRPVITIPKSLIKE